MIRDQKSRMTTEVSELHNSAPAAGRTKERSTLDGRRRPATSRRARYRPEREREHVERILLASGPPSDPQPHHEKLTRNGAPIVDYPCYLQRGKDLLSTIES